MTPRPGETAHEIAARLRMPLAPGARLTICPPMTYALDFGAKPATPHEWNRSGADRAAAEARRLLLKREPALRRAVAEGQTDTQLAVVYGVTPRTINDWRAKLGIVRPRPEKVFRRTAADVAAVVARVRELAAAGWSDPDIARDIGVTVKGVWSCRARNGIPAGKPK